MIFLLGRNKVGLAFFLFAVSVQSLADGIAVDVVYEPYVQPLETEVELRTLFVDDNDYGNREICRLGLGRSLSDLLFVEAYLIGEKQDNQSFALEAYEVEAKWQLTEQGEYSADWALLFELEKEHNESVREFSVGLLAAKELGRWTATANVFGIFEWGKDIDDEYESALALQMKYRYSEKFEPALEFYRGEDTQAFGPVMTGLQRFGAGKKVRWELGYLVGLGNGSPNQILKASLEYEF